MNATLLESLARALRTLAVACATLGGLVPIAGPAVAEDEPFFTPPPSSEWDWIELVSGEWLKGEIDYMRDRKIRFDSDELDDLDIDLDDCRAIYLQRLSFIRTETGERAQGRGVLQGDVLTFHTTDGRTLQLYRKDLVSIVPGGDRELDFWTFELGAAYAMKSGNTDQVDLSGTLGIHRRTATLRLLNDYRGIYGSQDGLKNTNNHRVTSAVDVFLTSRFYLSIPQFEYYRDEFKNLKQRITVGGGVGYEFVRNAYAELDVGTGLAYQYQEADVGGETSDDVATLLGVTLDFDLPGGTELDNTYQLQYVATDTAKTSQHFESTLSVDVWGPMDLDFTFMLDRIRKPQADRDAAGNKIPGSRPDSNDITILAGLSIDF